MTILEHMKNFIIAAVMLLAWNGMQAQTLAISTNAVELANMGTMNMDATYGMAQHWSVNAGLRYNPFSYGKGEGQMQNKQRSVSVGTRYWPWHVFSGWWLAASVRYQEYSVGGMSSPLTSEGDRFGSGIGGGYTYMLAPHFNLDFGLGLWAGYDVYRTYSCPVCGRLVEEGSKIFLLPGDIILGLSYIF